jgi:hypothetical protein
MTCEYSARTKYYETETIWVYITQISAYFKSKCVELTHENCVKLGQKSCVGLDDVTDERRGNKETSIGGEKRQIDIITRKIRNSTMK